MAVDETPVTQGRERQRRRTARAIVAAAGALLAEGRTPTVAEIADRAEVSRRTVHVHFPTLEQLLTDAVLGEIAGTSMEEALAPSRTGPDAEQRVAALARAIVRHHGDVQHLGRTMIKLTIDAGAPAEGAPRRGGRRVDWIETALEPARDQLAPPAFERLVTALAMVIGWEAMLVLLDVRGLSLEEAEQATVWAATALVRAALGEA
jgi:AcrR family transcriptional regulator